MLDVKLIGTEGEWINEHDPAGHELDLSFVEVLDEGKSYIH
jgi:hypothetical protein